MSSVRTRSADHAGSSITDEATEPFRVSRALSRPLLSGWLLVATVAGFVATPRNVAALAVAQAGDDLTRLLRAMAVMKALLALGATAAVLYRLGVKISVPRLLLYAVAGGAMLAGPGLIWDMAYVRTGAWLLHGGLAASVVLLWRDPAMAVRLGAAIAAKRDRVRGS